MILQIDIQTIKVRQMDGDVRSSSDDDITDSSENREKEKPIANGNGTPKKDLNHRLSPKKQLQT
jgi:sphingoid base N-palmitoyltransferase